MITVMGVGSTLLTDEGLGIRALEVLHDSYDFEPDVEFIDGGTAGMELLAYMNDTTHLLILDCVDGGKDPGHLFSLDKDHLHQYSQGEVSSHDVGIADIIRIQTLTRPDQLKEIHLVGMQPESLDLGLDLSVTCDGCLPELVRMAVGVLESWGVLVKEKAIATA